MKVRETSNKTTNVFGFTEVSDKKVTESKGTTFQNQLKHAEQQGFEEYVGDVVKQIAEQGDKLSKKVDIRELKIYKELLTEFMDLAVGNSRKFSKQSFLDRRGRHRVYAIIRQINDELDKLTKDVLQGEKDNISVLKSLDDIRGLILDMIM
ncbi:MAG: YaaR family protein [Bacillota bacterium]|nr:YaaR family protein [Bacillota bacterium]